MCNHNFEILIQYLIYIFFVDLTRTVIRQYGWTSYSQRCTDEWSTGIFQVVLPPVRRTLSEIVDEWIEDWLTQDRQLFMMFLLMFLMQTTIILGLNLIFRYESAVETIHQRLRPIMRVVMVLRLIWRLIKMIVLPNLSRLQRAIFPEVDDAGQLPWAWRIEIHSMSPTKESQWHRLTPTIYLLKKINSLDKNSKSKGLFVLTKLLCTVEMNMIQKFVHHTGVTSNLGWEGGPFKTLYNTLIISS